MSRRCPFGHLPRPSGDSHSKNTSPKEDSTIYYKFDILYFNARSLNNKITDIHILLKQNKYNIIFISETWLKSWHINSLFCCNYNYFLLRCDRHDQDRGGGVAAFIKLELAPYIHLIDKTTVDKNYDTLTFDFFPINCLPIRFICIYLPPDSSSNSEILKELITKLNVSITYSKTYIVGDFNMSSIDWNDNISFGSEVQSLFINFLNENNLVQLVKSSTHISGNILDLVIAPANNIINKILIEEPFTSSCDHQMIYISLLMQNTCQIVALPKRNFYKADYTIINEFLNHIDWSNVLKNDDIEVNYTSFIDILHQAVEIFVPFNTPYKKRLPKNLKSLLLKKKQLYKLSKTMPSALLEYKRVDRLYKTMSKQHFHSEEHKILCSGSIKKFYNYVNNKLKTRSILPPLLHNDEVITDAKEKADLLNCCFSKCFLLSDNDVPAIELPNHQLAHSMTDIHVSTLDVSASINKLKMSVSRTPENIPSLFVKKTARNLTYPLSIIFNQSLKQGKVPQNWTQAIVVPIHKKGLRSNPDNYRQVSLSSVFCRLLQNIIHKHISNHLTINNLISNSQHGFTKNRSTLTQQHLVMDLLSENICQKVQTEMIMLDFSKAFDKVSHIKLISVLKSYKINQTIIRWIHRLLKTRTQQTVVDNHFSTSIRVRSGVIQGSVLGPLLFNIYLNSLLIRLNENEYVKVFAFADDLKLISSSPRHLQQALYLVEEWCNLFKLQLNPTKSEHICFYERIHHNFFIGLDLIKTVETVRDLGVTLTNDLKWNLHTTKLTFKATSLSFVILRSFNSLSSTYFIQSYKSFIRPLLEYNTSIWNSSSISNIKAVEQVQRTFTRKLLQKLNTPFNNYDDRLKILNLESLQLRRLHFDLILVYKIIHGLIEINFNHFFELLTLSYNFRHHKFALSRQPAATGLTLNQSFKYRIVKVWNSLPAAVVESKNLFTFKCRLKTTNLEAFCLKI